MDVISNDFDFMGNFTKAETMINRVGGSFDVGKGWESSSAVYDSTCLGYLILRQQQSAAVEDLASFVEHFPFNELRSRKSISVDKWPSFTISRMYVDSAYTKEIHVLNLGQRWNENELKRKSFLKIWKKFCFALKLHLVQISTLCGLCRKQVLESII